MKFDGQSERQPYKITPPSAQWRYRDLDVAEQWHDFVAPRGAVFPILRVRWQSDPQILSVIHHQINGTVVYQILSALRQRQLGTRCWLAYRARPCLSAGCSSSSRQTFNQWERLLRLPKTSGSAAHPRIQRRSLTRNP